MLYSHWKEQGLVPILKVRHGLDQLFEDYFSDDGLPAPFKANGQLLPTLDVTETDDAITVDAEMPGLKQQDIHVGLEEGVLTISAERKQEKDEKSKNVLRLERHYGRMERKLALPASIEDGKVEAVYKDGVLHVTLPKKPTAKPKPVTVKVT